MKLDNVARSVAALMILALAGHGVSLVLRSETGTARAAEAAPAEAGDPPRTGGPGPAGPSAAQTLAEQMIQQGDRDRDGRLSAAELEQLTASWYQALTAGGDELTQDVFTQQYRAVLDRTPLGSGVMAAMNNGSGQAAALFAALDANKDGVLSREELAGSFAGWFAGWGGSATQPLGAAQLEAGLTKLLPASGSGPGGPGGPGGPPPGALPQQQGGDFSAKPPIVPQTPAAEQRALLLQPGYHIEPVLTDPDVEDPMAIAFDGDGRMYVLEERTYMRNIDGKGTLLPKARISVHEDRDGDGIYETHHVFLDNIVFPRFVLPLDKGQILTMESNSTDIYKYTDTNGDGVADSKELFATGMNRTDANVEHMSSALFWALDNHLYISASGTRLRITPKGVEKETISPNMGQWGISQDNYGRMFFQGGEIGVPVQFQTVPAYGSFVFDDAFEKGYTEPWGAPAPADFQGGPSYVREDGSLKRVTGASGSQVFRGDRLPKDLIGDYISGEPVARIVRRSKIVDNDGMTQLKNLYQPQKQEFIRSNDPLFRPLDMQTGPDGTLYIVDAYRGIIQESQWTGEGTYLRKKIQQYQLDKDVAHGRIWRVTYDGMPRDRTRPHMLEQSSAELVQYLGHPNGWWRDEAQKLIVLRQDKSVVPALRRLAKSGAQLARVHALWTLEGLGGLTPQLVRSTLADKDPRIRAVGVRISESLYQTGDSSFARDVQKLAQSDADDKVVIQSLLTLNYLKAPGAATLVRTVSSSTASRGVREFGAQILSPKSAMAAMMGSNELAGYSEAERKSLQHGQEIYNSLCVTCHALDGKGTPVPDTTQRMGAAFANSSTVQGDPGYGINALLHGLSGSKGDGKTYLGTMVGLGADNDDQWVADVLSYVRNSFGNAASFVTPAQVASVRATGKARTEAWPIPELLNTLYTQVPYSPDWKLAASASEATVGYAVNSSGTLGWSTGAPQAGGEWFAIQFPTATRVAALELVAPAAGNGYPRSFEVQVSADGATWQSVAEGRGSSPAVDARFTPVTTQHLRVLLRAPEGQAAAWSIQKLRVFAPPAQLAAR